MNGIRFDGQRLIPSGPPPASPAPLRKPTSPGQPGFAVEAATFEMRGNLTIVEQIGSTDEPVSAEQIRRRIEAHVKQVFEKAGIEWKELTPEEAQAEIDPGGFWSPEAVSKRILDFVKAFDTGDQARRDLLRDAVERGYSEAADAWGGELPEISGQTMKLVREGLNELFGAPATEESAAP